MGVGRRRGGAAWGVGLGDGGQAKGRVQERLQQRLLAAEKRLQSPRWRLQNGWRELRGGQKRVERN